MAKNYKNMSNDEIMAEYGGQVSGTSSKYYNKMNDEQLMNEFSKQSSEKSNKKVFGIPGSEKLNESFGKTGIKVPRGLEAFVGTSEAAKENALYGLQDIYQDTKSALGFEDLQAQEALAQKINQNRQTKEGYRETNPWSSLAGDIFGGTAAYAPLMAVPGIGQGSIARNVSNPFLRNIGIGASQGATQAGIEGLLQPTIGDESRSGNAQVYGATGGLLGGAASGLLSGAQELQPSRFLRGIEPIENIQKNNEMARGTNTPLSGVLNHPGLQKFESNYVGGSPLSGYNESNLQVNQQIEGLSEKLFNKAGNPKQNSVLDIPREVSKKANQTQKTWAKEDSKLYNAYKDLADKYDVNVDYQDIGKASRQILEDARTRTAIEQNPELMKKATKYASLGNRAAATSPDAWINTPDGRAYEHFAGEEALNYQLRTADELKKEIAGQEKMATRSGDDPMARQWTILREALEKDIKRTVESSAVPEVEAMRNLSNAHHKQYIVPAKEKGSPLRPHLKNPNTLKTSKITNDFIKRGTNQDQVELMSMLTDRLGPREMEMLRYQQLKGNNNQTLSQGMGQAWRELGKEQKTNLFQGNEQMIPEWERIASLRKMNPESSSPNLNPPTGVKLLPSAITGGAGILGGLIGGSSGVLPMIAGQVALGYGLNKLLRNEGFREKMVKEMVKGPKNYDNLNAMISSSLARYIPLSANENSPIKEKPRKQGKSVMVETKGEY